MIVFICLNALFLASTIYFAYQLSKSKKVFPTQMNETSGKIN